jgi:hypothetical protein
MWPVREENDAGQVEEALMPLWSISNAGTAILMVHHMRKSDGAQFVGARGSGGLSAFVEILMEFRREAGESNSNRREIEAVGRYDGTTPRKMLCELQHGKYIGLGDPDDPDVRASIKTPDWKQDLRAVFEQSAPTWLKFSEMAEMLKQRRSGEGARKVDVLAVLDKWINEGELERTGEGRSGKPYLYRFPAVPE